MVSALPFVLISARRRVYLPCAQPNKGQAGYRPGDAQTATRRELHAAGFWECTRRWPEHVGRRIVQRWEGEEMVFFSVLSCSGDCCCLEGAFLAVSILRWLFSPVTSDRFLRRSPQCAGIRAGRLSPGKQLRRHGGQVPHSPSRALALARAVWGWPMDVFRNAPSEPLLIQVVFEKKKKMLLVEKEAL